MHIEKGELKMRYKNLKKLAATGTVITVICSALAGCGTSGGVSSEADKGSSEAVKTEAAGDLSEPKKETKGEGTETITMWGWNAGDIEKIFNAYKEETGADVSLDYVTVQQEESFQKLQTTISAGLDLPDIVPSEVNQRGTMLSLDIWEDLSAAPYNFDKSQIFEYEIPLCSNEKGELCALPWDVSTAGLAYKRDLAKEYLAKANYNGEPFRILCASNDINLTNAAVALKAELESIGMTVEMVTPDWTSYSTYRSDPSKYDVFFAALMPVAVPSLQLFLSPTWAGFTNDQKIFDMVAQMNQTSSLEDGQKIWDELQTYCWNESLPATKLGSVFLYNVYNEKVDNFVFFCSGPIIGNMAVRK